MSDVTDKPSAFASLLGGFSPVVKVFLFVGFVIALFGIPTGINLQNRTFMIGVTLFVGAIAGHYWPDVTYGPMYTDDPKSGGILWGNLFLAFVFSVACALGGWFTYLGH